MFAAASIARSLAFDRAGPGGSPLTALRSVTVAWPTCLCMLAACRHALLWSRAALAAVEILAARHILARLYPDGSAFQRPFLYNGIRLLLNKSLLVELKYQLLCHFVGVVCFCS